MCGLVVVRTYGRDSFNEEGGRTPEDAGIAGGAAREPMDPLSIFFLFLRKCRRKRPMRQRISTHERILWCSSVALIAAALDDRLAY